MQLDRRMLARRLRHADVILGVQRLHHGRRSARALPELADRCHTVPNGVDVGGARRPSATGRRRVPAAARRPDLAREGPSRPRRRVQRGAARAARDAELVARRRGDGDPAEMLVRALRRPGRARSSASTAAATSRRCSARHVAGARRAGGRSSARHAVRGGRARTTRRRHLRLPVVLRGDRHAADRGAWPPACPSIACRTGGVVESVARRRDRAARASAATRRAGARASSSWSRTRRCGARSAPPGARARASASRGTSVTAAFERRSATCAGAVGAARPGAARPSRRSARRGLSTRPSARRHERRSVRRDDPAARQERHLLRRLVGRDEPDRRLRRQPACSPVCSRRATSASSPIGATLMMFTTSIADGGLGSGLIRRERPPDRAELKAALALQLSLTVDAGRDRRRHRCAGRRRRAGRRLDGRRAADRGLPDARARRCSRAPSASRCSRRSRPSPTSSTTPGRSRSSSSPTGASGRSLPPS